MLRIRLRIVVLLILPLSGCAFPAVADSEQMRVVYPRAESDNDTRYADLIEIVHTALEKTRPEYGNYTLTPARTVMTESRYIRELVKNSKEISLIWTSANRKKAQQMLPVKFPLRKGLMSYRISLVNRHSAPDANKLKGIDNARELIIGQGLGWSDVDIYHANGFRVMTSPIYDGLFEMIAKQRFDLFPRALNEIFGEYERQHKKHPELMIEENFYLYYPWPYYFFTNKYNKRLAQRLTDGLKIMAKDGSFDEIFYRYHQESITRAGMGKRKGFFLKNPSLPDDVPLNNTERWIQPGALKSEIAK